VDVQDLKKQHVIIRRTFFRKMPFLTLTTQTVLCIMSPSTTAEAIEGRGTLMRPLQITRQIYTALQISFSFSDFQLNTVLIPKLNKEGSHTEVWVSACPESSTRCGLTDVAEHFEKWSFCRH
jgi:hypothetical protein